jgi:hypothetical protein
MPVEILTLASIRELDNGIVFEAFQRELERCVTDCADRPADDRSRSVCLTVRLWPDVDLKAGQVHGEQVLVEAEVSSSVPKRRTRVYSMRPKGTSGLVFATETPENPDQLDLEDDMRARKQQ